MPFPQRLRPHFLRRWSKPSPPAPPQWVRVGNPLGNVLNPAHQRRPRPPGFPLLTPKVNMSFLRFFLIELELLQDSRLLPVAYSCVPSPPFGQSAVLPGLASPRKDRV